MRLWRRRKNVTEDVDKTIKSLEAEAAVKQAHEKLEATKAQRREVDRLTKSLQQIIRTNEFRARMEQAFRGRSS